MNHIPAQPAAARNAAGCIALVLAFLLGASSARAQPFGSQPSYTLLSGVSSVVLGDIDLDGDLDAVFGGVAFHVFKNEAGRLDGPVAQVRPTVGKITDMALGDLDEDGDLDLVCTTDAGNEIYRNDGTGLFPGPPMWTTADHQSSCVVLGDVNGDRILDVVFGSDGIQNEVFLNNHGQFEGSAWLSQPRITRSIDLGDMDDDGDLDMVVGNFVGADELYLNDGAGHFGSAPVWSSVLEEDTREVGLCDANGDGDLDLVVGDGAHSHLYTNVGASSGYLSPLPDWSGDAPAANIALGDVNCDGVVDLFLGFLLYVADSNGAWLDNTWGAFGVAPSGVALGDVDSDGTLDLVFASKSEASAVYLNTTGMSPEMFGQAPAWQAPFDLYDVAQADINGDGRVDLIHAGGDVDQVFLGRDGIFENAPWWSVNAGASNVVAAGDIDHDGDTDLVFGDGGEVKLYLNDSGTLGPAITLAGVDSLIKDLALGDIDDDGDLDLALTGVDPSPNGMVFGYSELHTFDAGMFSSTRVVMSGGLYLAPRCLALGDIDGDLDLDLAVGAESASSAWYRNHTTTVGGRRFDLVSSYGNSIGTYDLSLGDLNSDGILDQVFVRDNVQVHFSRYPGDFSEDVDWGSGGSPPNRVVIADLDGDGDLDICGNGDVGVYETSGGTIRSRRWQDFFASMGPVVVGDVDNDGDPDLFASPRLYEAARLPVYKGDLQSPTRQLPNNGSFVRDVIVVPDPVLEQEYAVRFSAFDVESDPVRVVMDFHFEGDTLWSAPIVKSGVLATSPTGVAHEMHWNARLLPLDSRNIELRLRTIEVPVRVSRIQHAAPYIKPFGRMVPTRPEADVASGLVFPAVTVGDTVVSNISITNRGNRELSIDSVELPDPMMRLLTPISLVVQPGRTDFVWVEWAPRDPDFSLGGQARLVTNDPTHPAVDVSASGYALALRASNRALTLTDSIPLGEALTIVVTPFGGVRVESGKVFYRPAQATSFRSAALTLFQSPQVGSQFIGIVPGDGVTESGVEYYIQVENSGLFGTDPVDAPNSIYFVPVHAPASVSANARPTSGSDFLEAREIEVQVALPRGAEFRSGFLHYRRGGDEAFEVDTLVVDSAVPRGTIRETSVGARGIEYWIEVESATRTLTDPPVAPAANPKRLQITLPEVKEPVSHAGQTYRMASFPISFDESFTGTIKDILVDEKGMGEYNRDRWRSWVWVTEKGGYGELDDRTMAKQFRPRPGRAFWLVTRDEHRIDTGPVVGKSTPTNAPYEITLQPGWTMLGDPFAFPVAWSSILSEGIPADEDTLLGGPYGFGAGSYQKTDRLEPFSGYWVHSDHAGEITLRVPPVEAVTTGAQMAAKENAGGWTLRMSARSGGVRDDAELGVSPDALDGRDRYDELAPPMSPAKSVSMYAVNDVARRVDRRAAASWRRDGGVTWAVDLAKNFSDHRAGDEVLLTFTSEDIPAGHRIVLLDRKLGREIDLRATHEYSLVLGERAPVRGDDSARFMIVVGSDAYLDTQRHLLPALPTKTVLYQNTPNPFNPVTVIRYDLAAPVDVTLRIYDLRGALVKNLDDSRKLAGRYEAVWNGENERGERVASGVYFYDFRAGSFRQTKKMVLLK